MRKYEVDVSIRLARAWTVEVPDDWDALRAEEYVDELMKRDELEWDVDEDFMEPVYTEAEEIDPEDYDKWPADFTFTPPEDEHADKSQTA